MRANPSRWGLDAEGNGAMGCDGAAAPGDGTPLVPGTAGAAAKPAAHAVAEERTPPRRGGARSGGDGGAEPSRRARGAVMSTARRLGTQTLAGRNPCAPRAALCFLTRGAELAGGAMGCPPLEPARAV